MESRLINNKKYYNITEPQKMIYFGELLHPKSSLNTLCATYQVAEQKNIEILLHSIQKVILENSGLNIRIHQLEGIPYQYKYDNIDYKIKIIDFSKEVDASTETLWIKSKATHSFDFFDSRLFDFYIYISHDNSVNLLILTHHVISDAWSHLSLATQIKEIYKLIDNEEIYLFTPKYSYFDYVTTENNYLKSSRSLKSRDYWCDKFKVHNSISDFVGAKKLSASAKAKRFKNIFNEHTQKKIVNICEKNNISFASYFLSCMLISLNIISNKNKHFFGTLSYNRLGSKEKEAVGMFVNTLPLYFEIPNDISFKEIVKLTDKEFMGLMRHQRYPLSKITNDPELKRLDIAGHMDIIFSYQNVILPYDYTYHYNDCSSYPLLIRPARDGEGGHFYLDIDYQVDCFKEEEIENISNVYQKVIELLDDDIDKSVDFDSFKVVSSKIDSQSDLPLVTKDHNLNQTLHSIFEEKVLEYPDNIAVTFEELSITYKELNRRANVLATILVGKGVGGEAPVVLVLDRSKEMMIAILAVLKAGGCYLPLSPDQPVKRTEKIIELSGSKIILCNSSCGDGSVGEGVTKLDLRTVDYGVVDVPNLNVSVSPENLAYIIYTSGSTGEPKGVMIEHKSVINRIFWVQDVHPLNENDVVMQKTPYIFDVSVWELFGWYLKGSRLHFLTPGAEKEPITIIETIYKQKITIIHFVPSMFTLFLEYLDGFGSIDRIKTLRRINSSGEAISPSHVNRFKRIIREHFPVELYNLYGPTEATVDVSFFDCLSNKHGFVPIGKAIDNVELYVLDEKGDVLPPGLSGELFIGGVCLARGYFNKPDLTADKFKYHAGLKKRLYSTGDIAAYLDDGNIKYLGRIDSQVKIRGNRVELGEIENCLLSLESIIDVAVLAPVDEDGNAYLGVYYIADDDIPYTKLRKHIQRQLPSYMVPSFFTEVDKFPLSPSGKLDIKALPEPEGRREKSKAFHAPINDREEEICEIWEDELRMDGVGRDDNFFDLGGDSLSMIKVHFALEEKYSISLQDLFQYQTIKSLAQHIHTRIQEKVQFDQVAYSNIIKQNGESEKIKKYFRGLSSVSASEIERVSYSKLLITGATGFLGAFLVKDYLDNSETHLYLLIRGESLKVAEDRLKAKLSFYFGAELYNKYVDRISVVLGDVSLERLGMSDVVFNELSNSVEAVVHSAANVRHYADRDDINKINVTGTANVISFCKESVSKRVFFVSTLSVGLNEVKPGWSLHFTEGDNPETDGKGNVYIDSKILAENLVREALPKIGGQIFRVGNLVSDSETGVFQENKEDNAFYQIMQEYKRRDLAPDVEVPFIDLSFVNQTASAIRLLTTCMGDGTFHLYNPNTITIQDMFYKKETGIETFKNYVTNIIYGDSVLTHGFYLKNINMLGFLPYCDKTTNLLGLLGFNWSSVGDNQVDKLWNSWEESKELCLDTIC